MKSLSSPASCDEIVGRVRALTPESGRRWGALTPNEMLCHLADAYEGAIRGGGRRTPGFAMRTAGKWIALYLPLHWPHGIRGPAAVDPRRNGTRPSVFEADRQRAERSLAAFADHAGKEWPSHPLFGPLSAEEWMRWGYLHADHHLRQFGL